MLKDRDLSGELKDIWGAVQAKREREKDPPSNFDNYLSSQNQIYIEFGPETSQERICSSQGYNPSDEELQYLTNNALKISPDLTTNHAPPPSYDAIKRDHTIIMPRDEPIITNINTANETTSLAPLLSQNCLPDPVADEIDTTPSLVKIPIEQTPIETPNETPLTGTLNDTPIIRKQQPTDTVAMQIDNNEISTTKPSPPIASVPSSTKKEKVGGFLPNSCHNIFPFMKSKSNNDKKVHKDKITNNLIKEENQKNSKKSFKAKGELTKSELTNTDLNKLNKE